MVSTGTLIAASDYNVIQSLVNQVLGVNTGGGLYGYGQTVDSSQITQYSKISVTEWRNLRSDILRCRQHQTGTDLSGSLVYPTSTVKVTATDRDAYLTMMQTAALDANRLIAPPDSEASRTNIVTDQTKSPGWNTTVTQTVTVTFNGYNITSGAVSAEDHIRCYFNTGSRFELKSSITGGQVATLATKDNSWFNLLSGMGTIYFNRTNTTCTGTGTGSSIGWSTLTTADQEIFRKTLSDGYTPNRYRIMARAPSSTQIVFTIYWEDLSGQPNPPWGTDETVTGTISSTVQAYRASGTNVTIPAPTAITSAII